MASKQASWLNDARTRWPWNETADVLLAALERANDATVIVDGDLRVSYFNAAAELIWGLDRADVLGCHVSRLGSRGSATGLRSSQRRRRHHGVQRSRSSARTAAGSVPRCRFRVWRPAVKAAPSPSCGTSPPRSNGGNGWSCSRLVADRTNRAVVLTDRNLSIVYSNAAFEGMFDTRGSERGAPRWRC